MIYAHTHTLECTSDKFHQCVQNSEPGVLIRAFGQCLKTVLAELLKSSSQGQGNVGALVITYTILGGSLL